MSRFNNQRCFIAVLLIYILIGCYITWLNHMTIQDAATGWPVHTRQWQNLKFSRNADFTPVVILSYMRSGSSLTGDIIQQNQDVFYVFEPLHDIQKDFIETREAQFPNYRFKASRPSMMLKTATVSLLRAWFTCDLGYILSERKRYHLNFFQYGLKTSTLPECINRSTKSSIEFTKRCTFMLHKLCMQSKFRVVKTIRTSVVWLTQLIEEFPNMKIVHLVRDPRAVISSQIKLGECDAKHGGVVGCSQFLCSAMEDDLENALMFAKLYPDRVKRFYFEDIAKRPITMSKALYSFLGMEFSSAARDYVFNATSAGNNATSIMSTTRSNSSEIIDQWKTSLSITNLRTVQIMCRYPMEHLSYHHFIKPLD